MTTANIDRVGLLTELTADSLPEFIETVNATLRGEITELDYTVLRRRDGHPVTTKHIDAINDAEPEDLLAVLAYFQHEAEQASYRIDPMVKANSIIRKYAPSRDATIGEVLPLMTRADRAEFLDLILGDEA